METNKINSNYSINYQYDVKYIVIFIIVLKKYNF